MIDNLKVKVEKAIEIFKNTSNQLSESELFDVFVECDLFKGDDYYFFVFVPLIITRLAYPEIKYSDEYYEYFDGVTKLGVFRNNILYNNIYNELLLIINQEGIPSNVVLKIVCRCGEFQLINDILFKQNLKLSDLKMLPITFNKW